jgi:hypothetical protein
MNWRRLGVALMLVGVLFGATGTYSAISVDADRGFGFDAPADELNDKDANYFDTKDRTDPDTTIGDWGTSVLRVYNQFGQPLTATELRVTDVMPVNASANGTTTNSSAVVVNEYGFSVGRTVDAGNEAPIRLECNPAYNGTVDARHEIALSIVVKGEDSGAEISLDRTVTANVQCN